MGFQDIVLAVDRQFIEASAVSNGGLPARHGDVLHREAVELKDAGRVVVQLLAILEIDILKTNEICQPLFSFDFEIVIIVFN